MAPPKILGDCVVEGCGLPASGRNYCKRHYQMWRRHGQPFPPSPAAILRKRLDQKIDRNGPNGCWLWTGYRERYHGYGIVVVGDQKRRASRIVYESYVGPIPDGLFACHKCDNPPCVNPAHIFLGTSSENFDDMRRKNRNPRGETQGTAKLRAADVRAIRADPRGPSALAREFGVTPTLITKVRKREVWKHVA